MVVATKFSVNHQGKDIHHPPSTICKWPLSDLPRSTLCPSLSLSFTIFKNCCILAMVIFAMIKICRLEMGDTAKIWRCGIAVLKSSERNGLNGELGTIVPELVGVDILQGRKDVFKAGSGKLKVRFLNWLTTQHVMEMTLKQGVKWILLILFNWWTPYWAWLIQRNNFFAQFYSTPIICCSNMMCAVWSR